MTDPPIRQQVMKYLAEQFPGATLADHQFGADGLLAIFTAHAARVRAEAGNVFTNALTLGARPSQVIIVGARMTEDVLNMVRVVEEAFAAAVRAEAVADEETARAEGYQAGHDQGYSEGSELSESQIAQEVEAAVADERQRIAAGLEAAKPHIPPPADPKRRESIIIRSTLNKALRVVATGSVPVATPEPDSVAEQQDDQNGEPS